MASIFVFLYFCPMLHRFENKAKKKKICSLVTESYLEHLTKSLKPPSGVIAVKIEKI